MENFNRLEKMFLQKHLEEDEFVFYVIHKHWIEIVNPMIKRSIIWIVLPLIFVWLYPALYLYAFSWFVFVFFMAMYNFFDWYLDVMLLTDLSIIDCEWNWFFKNNSSRMPYESVDAVYYEHDWISSSGFNYWNLEIEREWWNRTVFKNCSNPKKAELKILEAQRRRETNWVVDLDWLKRLLSRVVAEHMEGEWNEEQKKRKRGFRKK